MGLRMRITGKTIEPDDTLTVDWELAWADGQGVEVWRESHRQQFAGQVTKAQVLSEIRQTAEARAGAIAAALALEAEVGRTYERQPDGSWRVV